MIERIPHILRSPFALIFILALILRLIGVWLTATEVGIDALGSYPVDTKNYVEAAEAIRADFNFQTTGVIIFGPGYPSFLALIGFFLWPHPLVLMLFQTILGALVASLMQPFGRILTGNEKIGIIAGLAAAVMPQAIYLSTLLLSETLFVFLMLMGIIQYLKGIETQRPRSFILSAVLLTSAAFVRPVGQYMFIVLLVMAIIYIIAQGTRSLGAILRKMKWPVIVSVILVILTGLWIVRNNSLYGFNYLGFSGPTNMFKVSAMIYSNTEEITYGQATEQLTNEFTKSRDNEKSFYQDYAEFAGMLFIRQLGDNPWISFVVILKNVYHNTYIVWGWPYALLTFLGLLVMLSRRAYRPAIVIVLFYFYFAFFSGFTLWQGKRIFFPGQIFALVPISYLFDKTISIFKHIYFMRGDNSS